MGSSDGEVVRAVISAEDEASHATIDTKVRPKPPPEVKAARVEIFPERPTRRMSLQDMKWHQ